MSGFEVSAHSTVMLTANDYIKDKRVWGRFWNADSPWLTTEGSVFVSKEAKSLFRKISMNTKETCL